MKATCGGLA